tara:strand:- start:39 stop:320 length:282 start_codon:yes stop_codon:yes gene_type:complete
MEERTADEVAKIFHNAGDSVKVINADANYSDFLKRTEASRETEDSWKAMIKRNVDHLEIIKAYKKLDGTTSIWTTEDFTEIDAAIVSGKKLYS